MSISVSRIPTRFPQKLTLIRSFSSTSRISAPCSSYISITHPDLPSTTSSTVSSTLERFDKSTLATYSRPNVLLTRGKGLDLWAAQDPDPNSNSAPPSSTSTSSSEYEERKYLDFSSGIAVNSLGHSDSQIAEIAFDQANKLVHSSNLYHNQWSGELAHKLVELTKEFGGLGYEKGSQNKNEEAGEGLKVFLANSGTEANEAALKFARKHGGMVASPGQKKTGLVSFTNAFHGRTMGALSMTPNPKYQAPFAPLIGDVSTGTYNDISSLTTLITESTAGVIIEPLQGEGGIFPANPEFLKALRKRCNEVKAVLIFDEIQCGLFRSGDLWFHSELEKECHPDLVTTAKPLANGFPIGAVLMKKSVAEKILVGDHGTTFGGGPLVSRIGHHVLGRLSSPNLINNIKTSSKCLMERLTTLRKDFPDLIAHNQGIKESPRGKGLLIGISTVKPEWAGKIVKLARERGLIVLTAGNDTVRIVPSLIVEKHQIDKAVDILESCCLVLRGEVEKEGK